MAIERDLADEMHVLRYRAELLEARCDMRLAGYRTGLQLPRHDNDEVWDEGTWEGDVLELAQILGKMCHLVADRLEPLAAGKWRSAQRRRPLTADGPRSP